MPDRSQPSIRRRQRVRLTQREVDILFGRVVRNEARSLPARLSPRATLPSGRLLARRVGRRTQHALSTATYWVARGPLEQRLLFLLLVAVAGAVLVGIAHLPHWDAVDGPR